MPSRFIDKDHGFAALIQRLKDVKELKVKIGVLGSGKNERKEGEITNVEIGVIHEYGSPKAGIPERSFLRSTYDKLKEEWFLLIRRLLPQVYKGRLSPREALALVGQQASADVKSHVTEGAGIPPPLKSATIARKGSDRPLVDTKQLINSVTYAVGKDSDEGRFA